MPMLRGVIQRAAEEPQIIDCPEFHRARRLLDPAGALSFLALEWARLGVAFPALTCINDRAPQRADE